MHLYVSNLSVDNYFTVLINAADITIDVPAATLSEVIILNALELYSE